MSIPPQPPSSPQPYPPSGPYGQPVQPGPYGGPQGWPGQPPMVSQKTNALAIVAFVMSLLCGIPLVPLILGIIALSQIRNRGEKGKGLAVAAIVIHSLMLAFYAIVLTLGLTGVLDDAAPKRDTSGQVTGSGSSKVQDIRKGDCFNTGGDLAEYQDKDGGQAGYSVSIVPCDQAHEGEAYAVFNLDDGAYPGTEKVVKSAEEKCSGTALTDYVGKNAKVSDKLEVFYYYPQPSTWTFGDREITCFVGDPSGASTGSIRSAGS
ncbi:MULTISPECIES: DUF4190 domain-containing protein [unclassified Streptomyces]|uniref:DUF4190 domain-containing protein n=1 Tax=unclassified Streptomyces TaxID=2593676 RepID=UPI002884CCAE|nr:DUF4190 domain-containing protein [Streptomyces sp. DSM 41633]